MSGRRRAGGVANVGGERTGGVSRGIKEGAKRNEQPRQVPLVQWNVKQK